MTMITVKIKEASIIKQELDRLISEKSYDQMSNYEKKNITIYLYLCVEQRKLQKYTQTQS